MPASSIHVSILNHGSCHPQCISCLKYVHIKGRSEYIKGHSQTIHGNRILSLQLYNIIVYKKKLLYICHTLCDSCNLKNINEINIQSIPIIQSQYQLSIYDRSLSSIGSQIPTNNNFVDIEN